jgi:hypothetical protein
MAKSRVNAAVEKDLTPDQEKALYRFSRRIGDAADALANVVDAETRDFGCSRPDLAEHAGRIKTQVLAELAT